ncbi:cysteine hydrolase family protein [Paenibacillus cellulositrophicus]|uniref:cysteine hydrolase family protein n=1 Tax=Paenibacillus cellulositrophicus TaxID=562959 RepID=UPI003F81365D
MTQINSALLVMDLQNAIAGHLGDKQALFPYKMALEAARNHNIPVIFVRVAFREGYPEISPMNRMFARAAQYGGMTVNDETTQIHPELAPQPGEPIVTKKRISAFTGSDLEMILRAKGISKLILSGISTSGVVLSTLTEAADKDYQLTVLSDACFDPDPEVHRVLLEKVFTKRADVMTVDAWVDTLV